MLAAATGTIPAALPFLPVAAENDSEGLVFPTIGLMVWTLVVFFLAMFVIRTFAVPRIQQFLDDRARRISAEVEEAERVRREADEILAEYRQRLAEAREQADEILARARRAAETARDEAAAEGRSKREELVAAARRDIEAETRRQLDTIRKEVADLTVLATEKVTRKALEPSDHQRLVEEALSEVDFSALVGGGRQGNGGQ